MAMKIYLFNLVTGAYLGEDFADEDPFKRGEYVIPDDATTDSAAAGRTGANALLQYP